MNSILAIAQRLSQDRQVVAVKSQRIGDKTLARDGEATIRQTLVEKTVKARCDATVATCVAVLKVIAAADLVHTAERHGIPAEAARLAQARAVQDIADVLQAQNLPADALGIAQLRADATAGVDAAIAGGKSAVTLFGPSALTILTVADNADPARIAAALPGAAERLAAAKAAEEAAAQAKAAKAAEVKARKDALAAKAKPAPQTAGLKALAARWAA